MGVDRATAGRSRHRVTVGWAGGVALAVAGLAVVAVAVGGDEAVRPTARTASAAEAPATTPPPTTRPATTAPPVTAPGETAPGGAADTTLAPGPAERPAGLVGGAFYDALVGAGVDAGVARCAADDLIATTPEADLLALGVASVPRPAEVNALLEAAGLRCGVTPDQLAAAAGG